MGGTLGHRGTIGRLLLVVPLLAAALAFGSARPAEAAYSCNTYVSDQTIATSIVVPAGGYCQLNNVTVRGGVTVGAGAVLDAYYSDIRGNVSGSNVFNIDIENTVIRGNVSISGATDTVYVHDDTEVRGNVAISGVAYYADVESAKVSGSVTFSNFGPDGYVDASGSTIRVNLVCSNVPYGIYGASDSTVGNQVILTNCPDLDAG